MSVLSSWEKNYISLLVGNIFLSVHPHRQVLGLMQLSFSIFFLGKCFPAHILLYAFFIILCHTIFQGILDVI